MDKNTIKDAIISMVKEKGGGVAFAELERIEGVGGGGIAIGNAEKNIFFWFNLTIEAADALLELCNERAVKIRETRVWVYLVDGIVPRYPVAKRIKRPYKDEHWVPVVLNLPEQSGSFVSFAIPNDVRAAAEMAVAV